MINKKNSNAARLKRHRRIRKNISGTAERPRLNVFRSLNHIYAQIIDDETKTTLVSASSLEKDLKIKNGSNVEAAKVVGKALAEKAKKAKESLLKDFGHKITDISPALTAVTVEEKGFKDLKGLRVKGNFSLYSGRKLLKEEAGEIQFTENALSGIPVLNLSYLVKNNRNFVAVIDFCNEFSFNELENYFKETKCKMPYFRTEEILSGLIPQKLSYFIMKRAGIKENTLFGKLSEKDIKQLVTNLKEAEFKVTGTRDFDYSQVTCGGADSGDFNVKTLMSKKQSGLFVCGEILNVNGDCGGYNLHFAFTSGRLAGASAVKYLNNKG